MLSLLADFRINCYYIVDMDIEKFFDTVDHEWLMKFLGHSTGCYGIRIWHERHTICWVKFTVAHHIRHVVVADFAFRNSLSTYLLSLRSLREFFASLRETYYMKNSSLCRIFSYILENGCDPFPTAPSHTLAYFTKT